MSHAKPNILFIMPDQMRGDCLSLAGHPVLMTPNLDQIGRQGAWFRRAYTTCPSCIPARRALLTGQFPATNGSVGFASEEFDTPTLPSTLRDHGYRTALIGRHMHQVPYERDYGYQTQVLGSTYIEGDDYYNDLEAAVPGAGGVRGLGIDFNGWQAKPWTLPEHLHPTNWVVHKSREYLAGQTGDDPVFLTASFYAPHPPLIPPGFYFDRYHGADLPEPAIGHWEERPPHDGVGAGVASPRTVLQGEALRSAQAGYLGLINHLDDQLTWLLADFKRQSARQQRPWIIVFSTDHGEMLGDHYYFRKCEPYEGSARIPFLIQASQEVGLAGGVECDTPVCLEDILPTLLDLADVPCPGDVDGESLAPILRGQVAGVREWLHSEHAPCYSQAQAYHMLTDGRWKYIWRSDSGREELFDLSSDPHELTNRAAADADRLVACRERLINVLADRPEGFADSGRLVAGRPYPPILRR